MSAPKIDKNVVLTPMPDSDYVAARQRAQEIKPEGLSAALNLIRQAQRTSMKTPQGVPRRAPEGLGAGAIARYIEAAIEDYVDQLNQAPGILPRRVAQGPGAYAEGRPGGKWVWRTGPKKRGGNLKSTARGLANEAEKKKYQGALHANPVIRQSQRTQASLTAAARKIQKHMPKVERVIALASNGMASKDIAPLIQLSLRRVQQILKTKSPGKRIKKRNYRPKEL